ncbi:MAG: peptidase M15 [Clostridiales bacterium]|nr:peptidase M15 [Clostridiales bacterium]
MKRTAKWIILILICGMILSFAAAEEFSADTEENDVTGPAYDLPKGFVYVHDVIDDVILEMRYASTHNFTGQIVPGYEGNYAIMTVESANLLKEAADEFRSMGYRIKIYDAYRPRRAVQFFVTWATKDPDMSMQAEFYPDFKNKTLMVDQGYIARNSPHSKGSTLDMTLCDMDGNELDMGSCFDFFGPISWHGTKKITAEQTANREILRSVMVKHGFKSFEKEWWHYRMINQPYPDTYFDFPVR